MTKSDQAAPRYVFADLTLDTGQARVWRSVETIALSKLTLQLLKVLVEASPNLVTHEQLVDQVWGPKRIVTPENLAQRMLKLRRCLGDDSTQPRYIESVRGQGYRLIPAVMRVESINPTTAIDTKSASKMFLRQWPRWSRWAITAALVCVVVGISSWRGQAWYEASLRDQRIVHSLAVLPFSTTSGEIIVKGLHAQLLNQFSKINGLNLIARPSTLHYSKSDLPIPKIAEELQVEFLLLAEVQLARRQLDIFITLVDGIKGSEIDSRHFQGDVADIFELQAQIVYQVAEVLQLDASPTQLAQIAEPLTKSFEAYEFYLKGLESLEEDTPMAWRDARDYFDQAIVIDSGFAMAYAARALLGAYQYRLAPANAKIFEGLYEQPFDEVVANAGKALALNPDNDLAYYALGIVNMHAWRWRSAESFYRKAVELSPNQSVYLSMLGWFQVCALGRREGLNDLSRALALDPKNARIHELMGRSMGCLGDRNAAFTAMQRAVELRPTIFRFRAFRAMLGVDVLPYDEALLQLQELEPLLTDQRANFLPFIALSYARLGRHDDAVRMVERFGDANYTEPKNWIHAYLAIGDDTKALILMEQAVNDPSPGPGLLALIDLKWNFREIPALEQQPFVQLREKIRSIE